MSTDHKFISYQEVEGWSNDPLKQRVNTGHKFISYQEIKRPRAGWVCDLTKLITIVNTGRHIHFGTVLTGSIIVS